jgi:RNA polymerase sigma-70 factor (sigma-E family)
VGADSSEPVRLLLGESFEQFYRRNFRGLVALTLCLSGSRAAAEDIAQDAMMSALSRWDEVCQLEQPVAWVRRVAVNRATSISRRRMSELRALLRLGSQRQLIPSMPQADEEVWAAVRRLPRRQRQCVALHYLLDCSVEETARTLGCAQGTVKAHLHQARQTLSGHLAEPEGQS